MSDRLHDATEHTAGLERALDELRGDVAVRPEWRAELERALADVQPERARPRAGDSHRWSLRPLTAIAAALGFTVLGALGGSALRDAGNGAPSIAAHSPIAPTAVQYTAAEGGDIGVRFAVMAPNVRQVSLVGDFNGWDPKATPLTLGRDGRTWTIMLPLSSGRHTYAFVIDDEIVADPAAPPAIEDDFGKPSSFVLVASNAP